MRARTARIARALLAVMVAATVAASPAAGADRGPYDSNARGGIFDLRADWETVNVHSNDAPFDSDGGGPTGSFEGVTRRDRLFLGAGLFGVSPEIKNVLNFRANDPLQEKARLSVWAGRVDWFEVPAMENASFVRDSMLDTSALVRVGAEGGAIDELAEDVLNAVHDSLDIPNRELVSSNGTSLEAGVAGHVRLGMQLNEGRVTRLSVAPFAYGSLGTDVVETAAGVQIAVQPADAKVLPFLMMSRTGAYAPMFGGDGVSAFANMRVVAHDGLYGGLEKPFVIEGGVTAQATLFETLRLGVGAKCSSGIYDGAPKGSCIAAFRSGLAF